MKKSFLSPLIFLALALHGTTLCGQNDTLMLWRVDGSCLPLELKEKHIFRFDGQSLWLRAGSVSYEFNKEEVRSFSFLHNNAPVALGEKETANCYVIPKAGSYYFPTTKGNSKLSVGDAVSAEVLWETFNTDEKPEAHSLVSEISYKNGVVSFSTPETYKEGNALVAVRDAEGNILWSWHLWFTSAHLVGERQHYVSTEEEIMDRNLGALSSDMGEDLSCGLLYQWGRKDPFPGTASLRQETQIVLSAEMPSPVLSSASTGTIDYTVTHPTTFVGSGSQPYDWMAEADGELWGDEKTIYDPCPPGWKVAPRSTWTYIGRKSGTSYIYFDWRNYECGRLVNKCEPTEAWYPAAGMLDRKTGELSSFKSGYYWSANSSSSLGKNLQFTSEAVGTSSSFGRAAAMSVRPVRYIAKDTENSIGQTFISNESSCSPTYNLAGQRVDEHFRGIVIKNGKKKVNF